MNILACKVGSFNTCLAKQIRGKVTLMRYILTERFFTMNSPELKRFKGNDLDVQHGINDLSNFNFVRILKFLGQNKVACVEGTLKDRDGKAILWMEKTPFSEELIKSLCTNKSSLKREFLNDIYGSYSCLTDPTLNLIKTTLIYPATELHIAKFEDKPPFIVEETPDIYANVTLPYILKEQFDDKWVHNVLEHKHEKERIIFEDEDPQIGFVLLPDLKWNGKQIEDLYLLALVHPLNIKSLRDLNKSHLPLLRNILNKGSEAITTKYKISKNQLRIYIHYQPTFYHLHVHFTLLKYEAPGIFTERSHLLSTVINNIELLPDYYQKATLPFVTWESHNLLQLINDYKLPAGPSLKLLKKGTPGFTLSIVVQTASSCFFRRSCISRMNCQILVEYRKNLGACQFFIKKELDKDLLEVDVHHDSVFISSKSVIHMKFPDAIDHIPNSVSSLHFTDNSICFRTRTNPCKTFGSFGRELILSKKVEPLKSYIPPIKIGEPCRIFCNNCLHPLTKGEICFERILPLPVYTSSDFFCHKLSQANMIIPRMQDCLYGLYYYEVHPDLFEVDCVQVKNIFYCPKCKIWLGKSSPFHIQLWNSTTIFSDCLPMASNETALKDFLSIIKESIFERYGGCLINKLVLHCPGVEEENSTHYLLIWIIEKKLCLFKSKECTADRFELQKVNVSKVLYLYEKTESDVVKEWLKFNSGCREIPISKNMFTKGIEHLNNMSSNIPEQFRRTNNMIVSYIGELN